VEEATIQPIATNGKLQFAYLPAYAKFILENHLIDYIKDQLATVKELDTPLLKVFANMPDEQLIEYSVPSHTEFLMAVVENRLAEHLATSTEKWINNQLEIIGRDEIVAEDITQIGYARKKALLKFLPLYSSDISSIISIIKEVDIFQLESDTVTTNTYIQILQEKINEQVEMVKHREEQLLEAQEIASLGSFSWDLENKAIDASPQLSKILDLDHLGDFEYFINKIHPADKSKVKEAMQQAMAEGSGQYECEYRLLPSDGTERIIWSRGIVSFRDDKAVRFKGTVMNVTERHHMIQRLQRSETLYKQAQAMSRIGNWTWDLLSNKLTWSDELYRIYELEPGTDINYDVIYQFNYGEDGEKVSDSMKHTLETLEPFEFNYRIRLKDGTIKILHARGEALAENGKAYKMIGTLQDVTEQQLIEEELREHKEFIQKIANTTPSLIASYNINTGVYTYINKALETILGYDPEEAISRGVEFFAGIVHPDDIGQVMEKNMRALEEANANPPEDGNEMVVEFKYRMRHKDGSYRWFHTYGTIFDRNEKGNVEHVLNVSVDITEQEEAEQALYQKNIQLQQSNASLEEYAYVASHDLKEPLRKISTFSDRLLTSQAERLTDDGKLYIHKIIDSSRRMQAMISDLLTVSVISGNKGFEVHSLKDVLSEVLQALEYKIEEKKAVITSDDLPVVKMVPSQFRQLFLNLLNNSLKFTKEGVQPLITMEHKYLYPNEVAAYKLTKANRYLQVTVSDNGIGFDNQFSNKIFTIFQRLHGKTEYEGTGIGLAICKKIAENHGGTIIANGIINQGAKFSIIIPV
jgi:PAS domain S-box-containing protein